MCLCGFHGCYPEDECCWVEEEPGDAKVIRKEYIALALIGVRVVNSLGKVKMDQIKEEYL